MRLFLKIKCCNNDKLWLGRHDMSSSKLLQISSIIKYFRFSYFVRYYNFWLTSTHVSSHCWGIFSAGLHQCGAPPALAQRFSAGGVSAPNMLFPSHEVTHNNPLMIIIIMIILNWLTIHHWECFICIYRIKKLHPPINYNFNVSHIPVNSWEIRLFWIIRNPQSLWGSTQSHHLFIYVVFCFCANRRIYLMSLISGNPWTNQWKSKTKLAPRLFGKEFKYCFGQASWHYISRWEDEWEGSDGQHSEYRQREQIKKRQGCHISQHMKIYNCTKGK